MLPLPRRVTPLPGTCVFPDQVVTRVDSALSFEGYHLRVSETGIEIAGGSEAGVFYGGQTLKQLLPPFVYRQAWDNGGPLPVPCVEIEDEPAYAWRGCMLDVARHFLPKREVLRFIDLLAMHKLNVLHLHLTDDQGWRLQIRRYPQLTSVGAWRPESMYGSRQHEQFNGRPHGGYYTQDDVREIVTYAAQRFVTVVPEIDLPGHTQAAIAAYPSLGTADPGVSTRWGISRAVLNVAPETVEFFEHVFDEVLELFPSKRIGIGGDECADDAAQALYVRHFQGYLAERGRTLFGWDECLEVNPLPGATIAAWRGPAVSLAAAEASHLVISCPDTSVYLDYRQSDDPREPIPVGTELTLRDVWHFSVPRHENVIGAQCCLWTEHMDSPRVVDYMAFPRLSAFAEAVWHPQPSTYDSFLGRLRMHLERLDAAGVEYRPLDGPHPWQSRPDAPGWPRLRADREAELAKLTARILSARPPAGPDGGQ